MNQPTKIVKKAGRSPLNEVRMTVAERQKKYLSNPNNLIKHKLRMKICNDKKNAKALAT